MGYTAQIGAFYNVAGSLNDYFLKQGTAQGLPAFVPRAVANFDYPQQPLTFPTWSLMHLGHDPREVAQGRQLDPGWKGVEQVGLAEIDCWESYQRASGQQRRNLTILRDMAARVFATGAAIPILDVYGSTAAPTSNGTLIRVRPVRESPAPPDP